jgi:hypothetical protein
MAIAPVSFPQKPRTLYLHFKSGTYGPSIPLKPHFDAYPLFLVLYIIGTLMSVIFLEIIIFTVFLVFFAEKGK